MTEPRCKLRSQVEFPRPEPKPNVVKRAPAIVYVFDGCQWGTTLGRQMQLTRALSERVPVVFLANRGINARRWDFTLPSVDQISPKLHVVNHSFSMTLSRVGRRTRGFGNAVDKWALQRVLKSLGITDYVFWLSSPVPEYVSAMRPRFLIYDCIDPCGHETPDVNFQQIEDSVVKRSDVVFCTAHSLWERHRAQHANTFLLPNGCHPEALAAGALKPIPGDSWSRSGSVRTVGYIGTIDDRLDLEIVAALAAKLTECQIVIIGRVNPDQESRVAPLRAMKNVRILGEGDGNIFVHRMDVGIIPFRITECSDGINPVKMYMHLAAGKPVVATRIRECVGKEPLVYTANSAAEFVAAVRCALSEGGDADLKRRRVEFAEENTWQRRAERALDIIESLLPPRH